MSTAASSASAFTLPTERELRRLLTSRRPEDAARLHDWLDHPPPDAPDAVVSLLAHIAKDAKASSRHLKNLLIGLPLLIVVYGGGYFMSARFASKHNLGLLVMVGGQFIWNLGMIAYTSIKRRASNPAVLFLARTDDLRAVQYLADLWTPRPLTRREAAFNQTVSHELTRLLSERRGDRFDITTENALRRLVQRALPTSSKAWMQQCFRPTSDLTETEANLLLSVVRHLSHTQAKKAGSFPQADEAALQRVAHSPALGEHSHLLRDTAQTLLQQQAGR